MHISRMTEALVTFAMLGLALSYATSVLAQGVSGGKLPTRWDKDVSRISPRPEYPRPQMVRSDWQSLNGPWDYALTDSATTSAPIAYDGKILVPYPYESALSGVGKPSPADRRLWYRRSFHVPSGWRKGGQRVLLHFGAVNWEATVAVNATKMGEHKGGYDAFDYDITDALHGGENTLTVSVLNPLRSDEPNAQILGKQRIHPVSVLYTAATGIWQSVWIESVPTAHIAGLTITPDIDANVLRVTVVADGVTTADVKVTANDGSATIVTVGGKAGTELTLPIPGPHLWSPTDPHLYGLKVALTQAGKSVDTIESYFAMRKISLGKDAQGRTRIFLNNAFLFEVGALDQGYWPDGIYTAPTDDALQI